MALQLLKFFEFLELTLNFKNPKQYPTPLSLLKESVINFLQEKIYHIAYWGNTF